MEKLNLDLKVTSLSGEAMECTVREGKALELFHPKNIQITGDISTVMEYILKNYRQAVEKDHIFDGVVNVNREKRTIKFVDYPHNEKGVTSITAQLLPLKRLEAFGINQDQFFSQKEIAKLFRKNAILFESPEIVKSLIKMLDELTLVVENSLTDNNDKRGNAELAQKRVIKDKKGILPEFIELLCPLFEGQPPIPLKLEIEIEIANNRPVYALYCLEFDLLMEIEQERAFAANLPDYIYDHFVVVVE